MSSWIFLPIAWPLLCGLLLAMSRDNVRTQRGGMIAGALGLLGIGIALAWHVLQHGSVTLVIGGWEPPVGISLRLDALSVTLLVISAIVGLCGALFASLDIDDLGMSKGYASFLLILLAAVNGAFLTADLFNLFVWFEVMLMASFCLLALGRSKKVAKGTLQYVALNVLASFIFLAAIGLIYGQTGTLAMDDLAFRLSNNPELTIVTAAALLFVAFAIKAGAFPLNFWMAPAYPMASFVTGAVFAGLLTKVGVYAMLRVFAGPLAKYQEVFGPILITMGALTMVVGVLAAMSQMRLRRVLSFHILSQIGYMLVGVGLFTASSLAAAIYYTIHHILVKTNLFLVAGMMVQAGGSEDLTKVGGLLRRKPLLALLFVVPALSLAGIPPFSGFFAKFFLIDALLEDQRVCLAILAAAVSLLTLYSMTKMWDRSFWEKPVVDGCLLPIARRKVLAVGLLSVLTVIVSLAIEPALALADHIAAQLVPVEKPL